MSELFLVLRRRLDEVAKWVAIDTTTLKNAREAKGLSYEAVARNLGISAKTWERYEKDGRVPRWQVRDIADLLELEVAESPPPQVDVPSEADDDRISRLETRVEDMDAKVDRLLEILGASVPPGTQQRRGRV